MIVVMTTMFESLLDRVQRTALLQLNSNPLGRQLVQWRIALCSSFMSQLSGCLSRRRNGVCRPTVTHAFPSRQFTSNRADYIELRQHSAASTTRTSSSPPTTERTNISTVSTAYSRIVTSGRTENTDDHFKLRRAFFQRVGSFFTMSSRQSICTRVVSGENVSVCLSNSGELAVLSLHRPAAKNALSRFLVAELQQAVRCLGELSGKVRGVLVRSAVCGTFCAGADLKERAAMKSEDEVRGFVDLLRSAMMSIQKLPVPTIACIDGLALGGGLELAMACDFRCAGLSESVVVGLPETSLAIIPGAGGTQRLPRIVGIQKAKFLMFTAKRMDAVDALSMGVLDFVAGQNDHWLAIPEAPASGRGSRSAKRDEPTVAEGGVEAVKSRAVQTFAELFSQQSQKKWGALTAVNKDQNVAVEYGSQDAAASAEPRYPADADAETGFCLALCLAAQILANGPVAVKAAKQAVADGMQLDLDAAMEVERTAYERVLLTQDRLEALTAFKEKRKPLFKGS